MGRNLRLLKCRFPFSRGHVKRATYGLLYLYFRLSLQGARARSKRHTAAPLDLASYSSLCVFSPTERLVQRSQGRSRLGTRLPRPRGCMPPERGGGENRFHLLHLPRTGTYESKLGETVSVASNFQEVTTHGKQTYRASSIPQVAYQCVPKYKQLLD